MFVMSTYDATLGALLVITKWFFVVGTVGLTRRFLSLENVSSTFSDSEVGCV